ncbi:TadE family type IV pilus minor pilin [Glycomyces sp. NPDC047369]
MNAPCRTRPRASRPPDRRSRDDPRQRGYVTAETAAALPVVVAVMALGLWAVAAVGLHVRAIDAANSAAIAAARGEDPHAVAAAYLPDGASVAVSEDGGLARAVVTASAEPLGPLTPPLTVTATAVAPLEPGLVR